MRLQIFIFFSFCLIFACSNPLKKIKKEKNLSDRCYEDFEFLLKYLNKTDSGLYEWDIKRTKIDTFNFEKELYEHYYKDMIGVCWFNTLSSKEIVKLFGQPNNLVNNELNPSVYEYYIKGKNCKTLNEGSSYKCGILRFKFDKKGKPIGGILQPHSIEIH